MRRYVLFTRTKPGQADKIGLASAAAYEGGAAAVNKSGTKHVVASTHHDVASQTRAAESAGVHEEVGSGEEHPHLFSSVRLPRAALLEAAADQLCTKLCIGCGPLVKTE